MSRATICQSTTPSPVAGSKRRCGAGPILITCLLGLCFTLYVYSPGYMSWDSLDQLTQARAGVFKDNHPPLMAAIWSIVDRIYPGPFGMLLLQTTMFWGGLALFFIHLRGPVVLRVLAPVAIGLYPPVFGLLGTIWKDVLMLAAIMLVLGLAVRFQRRRGAACGLALILFIMIACGARHNAIVALPPLLVWLAHSFVIVRRKTRWSTFRRALVAAGAASLLIYFANSLISNRLTSIRSQLWQGMAVFDIAGISVRTGQLLFPDDLELAHHQFTQADLKRAFKSNSAGPLYRGWKDRSAIGTNRFKQVQDEQTLERLTVLWKNAILEHPGAYLAHRWAFFSHFIGWADAPVDTPIYGLYGPRIVENDLGLVFHPSELNEKITAWLIALSETRIYRVWVYLLALLVFAALGTIRYVRRGAPILLALSASALLYEGAYFVAAGSGNFRYSLWPILATLLCGFYLLGEVLASLEDRRLEDAAAAQAPSRPAFDPRTESAAAAPNSQPRE